MTDEARLIVVQGPTAIGKTTHAIKLAQQMGCEIVSCDSRQFYQELRIGVARPSEEELAAAKHHFIACRSVKDPYNVFSYEQEAIALIDRLLEQHDTVIAVGGSGLYIDALCHGVTVLPDPTPELRARLQKQLKEEGVEALRAQLKILDPDYYQKVDLSNGVRIQRALEVSLMSGQPYSQLIRRPAKHRPFKIERIVLETDRETLRQRINLRVDRMMEEGLEDEARELYPLRHLTALNTVGYKEFYTAWEQGNTPRPHYRYGHDSIVDDIKLNTWHYAKKQITWLAKYGRGEV